jgi:hypothetical protein
LKSAHGQGYIRKAWALQLLRHYDEALAVLDAAPAEADPSGTLRLQINMLRTSRTHDAVQRMVSLGSYGDWDWLGDWARCLNGAIKQELQMSSRAPYCEH